MIMNNPYLSITRTVRYDSSLVSEVYTYNINTGIVGFKGFIPYTSQYPVTCFDRVNNAIYYSHRTPDTPGDQLWVMDLGTLETKQLTKDLWAISDIQLIHDNVYIDASYKNSINTHHHTLTQYNPKKNIFLAISFCIKHL